MELEFPRLEFYVFFFLVHVRLHPRGNGLELEFDKLEFQKQFNLLKCFIRMLCSKFFLKNYYLANFTWSNEEAQYNHV